MPNSESSALGCVSRVGGVVQRGRRRERWHEARRRHGLRWRYGYWLRDRLRGRNAQH